MTEWKRYSATQVISAHRTGWRGALDAIVSAITGRPRLAVPQPVTVTIHATGPVDIAVFQADPADD